MTPYPVRYTIEQPARFSRLQLLIRLIAFCALGVLGLSFGTFFWFAFLALPVFAAVQLASREPAAYLDQDGDRVIRALRWVAAISAWAGLVAEQLPAKSPDETLTLAIDRTARPTSRSAILRVLYGLPSAMVLSLLGCIGVFVWGWGAVSGLVPGRVGAGAVPLHV